VWLDLLDLLDAVLQHGDDGVLVAQPGQPAGGVVVLVALTASTTKSTGPDTSPGSVCIGPGTTIGSWPSGRSSMPSRGVRPHTSTECPAW